MRTRTRLLLGLGVASALAIGAVGCRDDVHVRNREIHEGPPAGTLVESQWNTPRDDQGMNGTTTQPSQAAPSASPTAIGGGPPTANPPTGANDEGNPNMSEEPVPVKPDATDQSAGTPEPPPPVP